MKFRAGACALVLLLAGCAADEQGSSPGSEQAIAAEGAAKLRVALAAGREGAKKGIASARDGGALISYANGSSRPSKQEGAYSWFPVAISEEHALRAIVTGELVVPSPDGSSVKLRYERHQEQLDGNWTWVGRVVGGDQMQEAIITFGEKAVFGSIPQLNGRPPLSLQTRGGQLWAVQTDPSKAVSATKGHIDIMVPEAALLRSSLGAQAASQAAPVSQAAAVMQSAVPAPSNTIDVAIGYTPEFAAENNGTSGAVTRLTYLVQVGNQSFSNSGVNGFLRLVHAVQVSYSNATSNQTALQELTGNTGSSPVTVPASLAPLRAARDQYGADIAILVRKFVTPENEGCGIAWLNGANQTAITAADASWGYAVISDGYDAGTDGKTYFCADETLVHETGHLMGSAHDRANSRNSSGGLQYGRYAYSFGLKTAAAAGNFYTIMAYGDTGQTPYRVFSNPAITTCGGRACGVADSEDNARSLNQTLPIVATFRSTVVSFPVTDAPPAKYLEDFSGDGRADIFWKSSDRLVMWQMSGASVTSLRNIEGSDSYTLSNSGDTNGDKRMELIWTKTGAPVYIWLAIGNSFVGQRVADYPTGWNLGAVTDMDGDGKDDLVWVQAGRVAYWRMDGEKILEVKAFDVPSTYTLIGFGDISGDRRSDLIWKTSSTQFVYWIATAAGGYTPSAAQSFPADWTLAAVTDIDRDGRKDLVWQTQGRMAYWIMNGATVTRSSVENADDTATLVAVGDLNADGYADLVWLRDSTNLFFWLGNGTTFTRTQGANYPAGWEMVN